MQGLDLKLVIETMTNIEWVNIGNLSNESEGVEGTSTVKRGFSV